MSQSSERKLFGTDGIRGKANRYPMTGEVAMRLGRAVTHYFQQKSNNSHPVIVIGKDTRRSCYMLEMAFSSGVCAQGGRAILTGPLPTPGVAFVTQSFRADAGVMISASHNPYFDNGIKIFDANGLKLPDDVEVQLEQMVLRPDSLPEIIDDKLGRAKRVEEVYGRYIVFAKSCFSHSMSLEGFKVVVDCANGAAHRVGPSIFSELGATVIPLGISPNGVNINDQCGAMAPDRAIEAVKREKADLGICLDGDADRILLIGASGEIFEGDQILGALTQYFVDTGEIQPNMPLVGTIMTNMGLEYYLKENFGMPLIRTDVGDRYILEKMLQQNLLVGGEPSGHVILRNYSTTGDGIVAALKILEASLYYSQSVQELLSTVTLFPQKQISLKVEEKKPLSQCSSIQAALEKSRELGGDLCRVVLRYSGTEPKIRLMVEGRDATLIQKIQALLTEAIKTDLLSNTQ